jgi:hypothetical protein
LIFAKDDVLSAFLLVFFGLALPRITILFIWALTDWVSVCFDNIFFPIVSWFIAPYTFLAYLAVVLNKGRIEGVWVLLLSFAILLDVFHFQSTSLEFRDGEK